MLINIKYIILKLFVLTCFVLLLLFNSCSKCSNDGECIENIYGTWLETGLFVNSVGHSQDQWEFKQDGTCSLCSMYNDSLGNDSCYTTFLNKSFYIKNKILYVDGYASLGIKITKLTKNTLKLKGSDANNSEKYKRVN